MTDSYIEVHPCDRHRGILCRDFPFERALEIGDSCGDCEVIG